MVRIWVWLEYEYGFSSCSWWCNKVFITSLNYWSVRDVCFERCIWLGEEVLIIEVYRYIVSSFRLVLLTLLYLVFDFLFYVLLAVYMSFTYLYTFFSSSKLSRVFFIQCIKSHVINVYDRHVLDKIYISVQRIQYITYDWGYETMVTAICLKYVYKYDLKVFSLTLLSKM